MKLEGILLSAFFAVLLMFVPVLGGGMGLSWDATNHQIYLGWIAERPRFDLDVWAAATQSFQYPYLYWPAYKLYSTGAGPMEAGLVLAALQCTCVPAVWLLARVCVPEFSLFGTAMRTMAMGMAFASSVVLSMFNTTANDLLSAIPLIWAIAIASFAFVKAGAETGYRRHLLVGALCGISVAFKLSNGPIAISVPLLFLFPVQGQREPQFKSAFFAYIAMLFGFGLAYVGWGWQLASRYGNPIFPLFQDLFGGSGS